MVNDILALYRKRGDLLQALVDNLTDVVHSDLAEVPHIDRISFRVKDPGSFFEKSCATLSDGEKKYLNPLREIEDQVAGRVIVFYSSDIRAVSAVLEDTFRMVESEAREPEDESSFGYESYHHIFLIPEHHKPDGWDDEESMPVTFELQVRTLFMHAWAEPQHDLGYKGEELSREVRRKLAWVAASAWGADRTMDEIYREIMKM
ncbi:GTP pyrophosphokinase family protein [Streptomyces sp. NPDC003737]|uniref:GTP pyrophosphokinase n=1 Tax=Streptomyces sp. NPDC003737 TaxID=3364685 RepID=UPI0036AD614F